MERFLNERQPLSNILLSGRAPSVKASQSRPLVSKSRHAIQLSAPAALPSPSMSKPNKRRQIKTKARSESPRKRKSLSVTPRRPAIPLEDPFLSERMLRPTLTGLLLGGHFREADELIDFVVKGPSAHPARNGVLPEFLWLHSWSAFLAGDSQKSKDLAFAAEKAFPDSSLAILVETKEDDDRLFESAYCDENTEMFADLMDAFIVDNPFRTAARQWFGMEQEAGAPD
jgi:hypothetical protein